MSDGKRTVKGVVTGSVFGLCTNVSYEDGCQRPGAKNLPINSTVVSEASMQNGICEHIALQVIEPKVAEVEKPQPVRRVVQPVQPATQQLTVQNILAAVEQRKAQPKRAVLPETDAPVSQEIVEAAKQPPKIRVDLATSPLQLQAAMKLPMELRFDDSLEGYTQAEIEELMRGPREVEPIGGDEPLHPFDSNLSASPTAPQQRPVRRGNRPVSKFDL